jgi:hypothetical protein
MTTITPTFSGAFRRLYCDATVFDPFSTWHPIRFARVLPFHLEDPVVDDERLLRAEEANLAGSNDQTRREVVQEYARCGLIPEREAENLQSVIDFFSADFFEMMGILYANAGMFRCALRWYRELVRELETQNPNTCSDHESVYASVGYCLYSLGLFAEAIAWSKACIGPRQMADAVNRALIAYEAQLAGGRLRSIERSGPRTRYLVSAFDPDHARQMSPRLIAATKSFAPFQDTYIDWIGPESPSPEIQAHGYPFEAEFDGGTLLRHKMNLIFATCGQADALVQMGHRLEARRLLTEVAMLEPAAGIVAERLKALS